MDVGEVRERTGLSAATLRHYVDLGLIASSGRAGLRRQYGDDVVERLAVIVLCQQSGFTLAEIGELLASRDAGHRAWRASAKSKLDELDERIAALSLARDGISHSLDCRSVDIMRCVHFRAHLESVFSNVEHRR